MYEKDTFKVIDRREMLRVKIKSLVAEAIIIRQEEKRAAKCQQIRNELTEHRKGVLRREARITYLAYGLIKGRSLEQIEKTSKTEPNWVRVREMIKRYGPKDFVYPSSMNGKGEKIGKPAELKLVTVVPVRTVDHTVVLPRTVKQSFFERVFGLTKN